MINLQRSSVFVVLSLFVWAAAASAGQTMMKIDCKVTADYSKTPAAFKKGENLVLTTSKIDNSVLELLYMWPDGSNEPINFKMTANNTNDVTSTPYLKFSGRLNPLELNASEFTLRGVSFNDSDGTYPQLREVLKKGRLYMNDVAVADLSCTNSSHYR